MPAEKKTQFPGPVAYGYTQDLKEKPSQFDPPVIEAGPSLTKKKNPVAFRHRGKFLYDVMMTSSRRHATSPRKVLICIQNQIFW